MNRLDALRVAVRCLRETGRFVDEEGEATNDLEDLARDHESLLAAFRDLLSVRDHFAIAALPISRSTFPEGMEGGWDALAAHAYTIADAMMRARTAGVTPTGDNDGR